MDSSDREPLKETTARLPGVTSAFEFVAKYGAAFGLTALVTAFLYDSIYWWIVDSRILGYYLVSDHVQTAVRIIVVLLPVLVFLGLFFLSALLLSDSIRKAHADVAKNKKRFWLGVALFIAMAGAGFFLISRVDVAGPDLEKTRNLNATISREFAAYEDKQRVEGPGYIHTDEARAARDRITAYVAEAEKSLAATTRRLRVFTIVFYTSVALFVISLPVTLFGAIYRTSSAIVVRELTTRPLLYILPFWALTTVYVAVAEGVFIREGLVVRMDGVVDTPQDTILLDNDRLLVGTIVRSLDKGLVLRESSTGGMHFIPKERVHRVSLIR